MKTRAKILFSFYMIPIFIIILLIISVFYIGNIIQRSKYDLTKEDIEEIEIVGIRDYHMQFFSEKVVALSKVEREEFIDVITNNIIDSSYNRQMRYLYIFVLIKTKERQYKIEISKGDFNLFINIECGKYKDYRLLRQSVTEYLDVLVNEYISKSYK
jgi:hypothetical protein